MKIAASCKKNLKTQEEDREFLIKQLVSVKKENARLRYSFDQANFSEQEKQRIGLSDADIAPELQLERESRSMGQLRSSGVFRIETASAQAQRLHLALLDPAVPSRAPQPSMLN